MTAKQTDSEFQTWPGAMASRFFAKIFPHSWLKYFPAIIVLIAGISITALGSLTIISENRKAIRQNFENAVAKYVLFINHSIKMNITAPKNIRGLFDASTLVNRTEFKKFTSPILKDLVGIQALEWIPRVPDEDRAIYERQAQQDGLDEYIFYQRAAQGQKVPAGRRKFYYPVYFAEPLERNKVALGFDLGSSSKRLKALNVARDTGEAVATAPITLVQETGKQFAFLVFVPIYRHDSPVNSVESRRNNIVGFSLGVYRIGDMIEATLNKFKPSVKLEFSIFDVTNDIDKILLYRSDHKSIFKEATPPISSIKSDFYSAETIDVSGKRWKIEFRPTSVFVTNPYNMNIYIILVSGFVLSIFSALYTWKISRESVIISNMVVEKTKELTVTNIAMKKAKEFAESTLTELGGHKKAMDEHAIVAATDTKGTITYVNDRFCNISGYTCEELLGKNHRILNSGHHKRSYFTEMYRAIACGTPWNGEIKNKAKDGSFYWVDTTIVPFYNDAGKIFKYISIRTDITDRKLSEMSLLQSKQELASHRDHLQEKVDLATMEVKGYAKELQSQADELKVALAKEQELNKLQREFVSMASHEFRTPLAIIDMTAQRIRSRAKKNRLTPQDAIGRVDDIREAVRRMTRLMEATLSAGRLQEGKIKISISSCDISTVLREVCARQQEISPSHVISCDLSSLPATIQADTGALEQVLYNLLSNAVKYAPDAPDIEVKARTEVDQVIISVRDHGLGIDEDDLDRIGERFFRAKTSTGIEGTGIGLNLVKLLLEYHGGTLSIQSTKSQGSTFALCLPIVGPEQSEQAGIKAA